MQIQNFIQKLEDYKYNAVNGNRTTALIIDNDIFGKPNPNVTIRSAICTISHIFNIVNRTKAIRMTYDQLKSSDHQKTIIVIQELQKLNQQRFPWVYIRHDHLAYPLVKNILWNVLNRIEIRLKEKIK